MGDMNCVVLVGRLVDDADLKYTKDGTAVSKFRLASNYYQGKDKEDGVSWQVGESDYLSDKGGMMQTLIQLPEGKMMFRPACYGFAEAMREAKEIDATPEALRKAVLSVVYATPAISELECNYSIFDPRNGWDTYYVVLRGLGIVGYCTKDVFKKEE